MFSQDILKMYILHTRTFSVWNLRFPYSDTRNKLILLIWTTQIYMYLTIFSVPMPTFPQTSGKRPNLTSPWKTFLTSQFPNMIRAPKLMLGAMLPLPIAWRRTCTLLDYDLGRRMDVPVLLHWCHLHRAASSGGHVNLGNGGFWRCIYIVILTLEFKIIQSQVWNKLLFELFCALGALFKRQGSEQKEL